MNAETHAEAREEENAQMSRATSSPQERNNDDGGDNGVPIAQRKSASDRVDGALQASETGMNADGTPPASFAQARRSPRGLPSQQSQWPAAPSWPAVRGAQAAGGGETQTTCSETAQAAR